MSSLLTSAICLILALVILSQARVNWLSGGELDGLVSLLTQMGSPARENDLLAAIRRTGGPVCVQARNRIHALTIHSQCSQQLPEKGLARQRDLLAWLGWLRV